VGEGSRNEPSSVGEREPKGVWGKKNVLLKGVRDEAGGELNAEKKGRKETLVGKVGGIDLEGGEE